MCVGIGEGGLVFEFCFRKLKLFGLFVFRWFWSWGRGVRYIDVLGGK